RVAVQVPQTGDSYRMTLVLRARLDTGLHTFDAPAGGTDSDSFGPPARKQCSCKPQPRHAELSSASTARHPTMEGLRASAYAPRPRGSRMNEATRPQWLTVTQGTAPVILSVPHAGIEIPTQHAGSLVSPWLARKDTDWWVDRLYDFAPALGVTFVRTAISRTLIDPNRDPSGASLYPGQATTDLCP